MLGFRFLVAVAVNLTAITGAVPLGRRAPIASDQVVPFPQLVPSGSTGQFYLAYQPFLVVSNGCVPFPAVDSAGNTKSVLSDIPAEIRTCILLTA